MNQVLSIILTIRSMLFPGFDKHQFVSNMSQNFQDVHQAMDKMRSMIDSHPKRNEKKVQSDEFYITGFWESYRPPLNPGKGNETDKSYYTNDLKEYDQLVYSFLTLDHRPNATHPHDYKWDGNCLYDPNTHACAENSFAWADPTNPQAKTAMKNKALYDEVKGEGKLFVFGIGGYSDTKGFMSLDQVHDFANYIVYINGIVGDGINIDYEHLSATGMDRKERIKTMAHLLHYTRRALIGARLEWKTITYTCRYNAVYNDTNRPDGFKKFESDGELVEIAQVLKEDFNEKLETNV